MVILHYAASTLVSPERNQIQAYQQCSSVTHNSRQKQTCIKINPDHTQNRYCSCNPVSDILMFYTTAIPRTRSYFYSNLIPTQGTEMEEQSCSCSNVPHITPCNIYLKTRFSDICKHVLKKLAQNHRLSSFKSIFFAYMSPGRTLGF